MITGDVRQEVVDALFALQQALEELVVRGTRSAGPDDVRRLDALGQEFSRAGAGHLAEVVGAVVAEVRGGGRGAARALLRAQTTLRVFERVLSLDEAAEALASDEEEGEDEPSPVAAAAPPSGPPAEDRRALLPVLAELGGVVEGLVDSGLTTASAATRQKLDASFREASRLKLSRLAASLRYVSDELGRFISGSEAFSPRRLAFFLNRTWLITRGLEQAIRRGAEPALPVRGAGGVEPSQGSTSIDKNDAPALARLLWQAAAPQPVRSLTVAVVGVQKRALLDGSASFDFRLRTIGGDGGALVWSCVFGAKPGVPAEAFLHLPQPQKFSPKILLEPTEIVVTDAALARDPSGGASRLLLGPKSTVTAGKKLPASAWAPLYRWDPATTRARWGAHRPTPLDLEVELQEEILVDGWELDAPEPGRYRPEQRVFPLRTASGLTLDATVSGGPDGVELAAALEELRGRKSNKRPPLYGLMHVDMCRLVFQPLALVEASGPRHLMISSEKIDLAALMKTLDFRS